MTGTGTLNVPTKERAIVRMDSARALTVTKEKVVGVNLAQTTAPGMELANT